MKVSITTTQEIDANGINCNNTCDYNTNYYCGLFPNSRYNILSGKRVPECIKATKHYGKFDTTGIFSAKFIENQTECPPEILDVVNKNFFDLI